MPNYECHLHCFGAQHLNKKINVKFHSDPIKSFRQKVVQVQKTHKICLYTT